MSEIRIISRKPIDKGWSGDQKYCAEDPSGKKYLLRVSPIGQYERKKAEFEHMKTVAALGIPMCLPLKFGISDEGVYSVQSWIDGTDAEAVLPTLSEEERYAYGFRAGELLRKIHTIPAPEEIENWEARFNRKIDRKIRLYSECPLKYDVDAPFLAYIEAHRALLRNRPQTYQHGDYHVGNMMIDRSGVLHVIDFNRDDYGDPWEEFNRIVWCAQSAPTFASGMVDGYFERTVPIEFWELLALYIASNTLSSLPWAIPFGDGEIQTMRRQANDVLAWYDGMKTPIPSWYQSVPRKENHNARTPADSRDPL